MTVRPFILGLMTACAAGAIASAASADPPGFVGRVSHLEGEVAFLPPGELDWTDAIRNFPVAPGESFWTGDGGRAELQIGGLEARIDNETDLDILGLDYGQTRLGLPQGSMDLRIWRLPRGGVSVSTPAGVVRIQHPGIYRIDVGAANADDDYPPVEVTVFEGTADVPGPDGYSRVDAGDASLLYPGYDAELIDAADASIDDWARDREASERWTRHDYLSPALTGFEDLDAQGDFVADPDYGQVWYPHNVPADWAPYRYGHWAYVNPWGWTWIDDQSWGFAPFHYGRWAQVRGRWGWIPGRATPEPVYAPALVAFIGGPGWSVSVGGGAVGWVPLGPEEVYRPTYRVSDAYLRQVNVTSVRQTTITNITVNNVTNITVNQYRNAPAVTVVRSDSFARGAAVQKAIAPVSAAAIAAAPVGVQAARPEPTAAAKQGGAPRLASPTGGPAHVTAPLPARLQAVRTAVAAQAPDSTKPPVIAGTTIAPPKPRPAGAPAGAFIAPAQIRAPAAQGRQPVPVAQPVAPVPGGPPRLVRKPPAAASVTSTPPVAGTPPKPRTAPSAVAPAVVTPPAGPVEHPAKPKPPAATVVAPADHSVRPKPPVASPPPAATQAEAKAAAEQRAAAQAQAQAQAQARARAAAQADAQRQAEAAKQAAAQAQVAKAREEAQRKAAAEAARTPPAKPEPPKHKPAPDKTTPNPPQ